MVTIDEARIIMNAALRDELNERWDRVKTANGYPAIGARIVTSPVVPLQLFKALHLERYKVGEEVDFFNPVSATASFAVALKCVQTWGAGYRFNAIIQIDPWSIRGFEAGPEARKVGVDDIADYAHITGKPSAIFDAMDEWLVMGRLKVRHRVETEVCPLIIAG